MWPVRYRNRDFAVESARVASMSVRVAMTACRSFLVWLCCALVVLASAPRHGKAACERRAAGAPSCCGEHCHCGDAPGSADACDCGGTRAPAREPVAPAPPVGKLLAPAPSWQPLQPVVEPEPRPAPHAEPGLPIGLLPRVSRQKALSVWRC